MSALTASRELAQPGEAHEPAELRGHGRDDVRLLVAHRDGAIEHARFAELPELLAPGDLLAVNTSATMPAAVPVWTSDGELRIHLSTPARGRSDAAWLVELRRGGHRFRGGNAGDVLLLPAGGTAVLLERFGGGRLWLASLRLPVSVPHYLARHGEPIRYGHATRPWPLERYQTVYANAPGSAEMPSAGRAFTPELVTQLVGAGIDVAPLVLHTGVSSLEAGEMPHAEWYSVPRFTAERINLVRALGGRVIAVGTTAVRALESAVGRDGRVRDREGWTDLVIEPDTPIRAVDGLLSGFHDRDSSHLAMLEAIAGADLLERSYDEAAEAGYLRHELGDLHLILPAA
ncbi:MAG: S-adenosylmethionine:tRNA ribosyltransferase-isomerase [Thermoleophilaceae bacterium]|nr:S-adenosylmethionine:tRNA ribosyltransferase-isomerase [Thermoleophilaceae bacterium]